MKAIRSILAAGLLFTGLAAFGQNGGQPPPSARGNGSARVRDKVSARVADASVPQAPIATPMEMAFAIGRAGLSARGAVQWPDGDAAWADIAPLARPRRRRSDHWKN
jgi:hypothetical protein